MEFVLGERGEGEGSVCGQSVGGGWAGCESGDSVFDGDRGEVEVVEEDWQDDGGVRGGCIVEFGMAAKNECDWCGRDGNLYTEMEVCSRAFILTQHGEREIQLCLGDITALPLTQKVDIIIVSAFAGDYSPVPGTVIEALERNLGLNVEALARNKKEDLRIGFNCWISNYLKDHLPYRQLVCFERLFKYREKTLRESVEQMFRALFPAFNNENKSVITPLLMTGCQQKDHSMMLTVMVKVAVGWMLLGLPLQLLKIIIYSPTPRKPSKEDQSLITVFQKLKKSIENAPLVIPEPKVIYDVYFMKTTPDEPLFHLVLSVLSKLKSNLKFRTLADVAVEDDTWKHDVHLVMQRCRRIVPLLTTEFLKDLSCVDQYNVALCCNRTTQRNILAPICFERMTLPTYMSMVQWINCRDRQPKQISSACEMLLEQTKKDKSDERRRYDVFISYSHRNTDAAKIIHSSLLAIDKNLSIFFDNEELKSGDNWQKTLYESIDSSRCMLALLSEDYFRSDVCNEEFSIAMALHFAREKNLELIVVLQDDAASVDSLTCLHPIRCSEKNFSDVAKATSAKICDWLKNGIATDILSPVESALCSRTLAQRWRQWCFDKFYSFDANQQFSIKSNEPPAPQKDSYSVFISHSTRNSMLANFLARSFALIRSDVKVYAKSAGSDSVTEQKMLHAADMHVVLLSRSYVRSPRDIEELNVILGQTRGKKDNRQMYVIRVDQLPLKPTYMHLIHCDTALDDDVWEDVAKKHGSEMRKEFTFAQRHVEDKEMKLKRGEVMALVKAFADISWKLEHQRNLPGDESQFLLLNVVDLHKRLNGAKESASRNKEEELQPNFLSDEDAKSIQHAQKKGDKQETNKERNEKMIADSSEGQHVCM
ncbi:hypothetical protein CAPTEDRAFT_227952 [Capitella teleta]|uniref:ADP-ribosyl cyclase/cyclic ADP-ribose hydrolase n=1 Tax=Capitella teleta TaxID=283909 RepID=R7TJT7_CAPTE|nr:hypothetical protein CAPTEDRAFT_227952 [Capitella teleta]|eukprot:ELT94093.1 hypothetical protein CAPTEDRAFT_227952 [Capitella teleta]